LREIHIDAAAVAEAQSSPLGMHIGSTTLWTSAVFHGFILLSLCDFKRDQFVGVIFPVISPLGQAFEDGFLGLARLLALLVGFDRTEVNYFQLDELHFAKDATFKQPWSVFKPALAGFVL
jgi:hypothetical protein